MAPDDLVCLHTSTLVPSLGPRVLDSVLWHDLELALSFRTTGIWWPLPICLPLSDNLLQGLLSIWCIPRLSKKPVRVSNRQAREALPLSSCSGGKAPSFVSKTVMFSFTKERHCIYSLYKHAVILNPGPGVMLGTRGKSHLGRFLGSV